jgi:Bacteriocin-protection, YdeI or OmpD-Associated/Domain of unknown function (DUF1905)
MATASGDRTRRFTTIITIDRGGRFHVPVPFDPDEAWGAKPRHPVAGSLAGHRLRGTVEHLPDGGHAIVLGPSWCRDSGIADGDEVDAELVPEGPQRGDLAPDIAAALDASPQAAAFFDALAQFYRKGYLRYIDATKRRPEQRPLRIAEVIALLEAGQKERPQP